MQISVKNIDQYIFREFKAESVREKMPIGKALTFAMKQWMEKKQKKPKLSILHLKPISWGKGTERLSEESDSVLYE